FDDGIEPLGHGAIRFRHGSDAREHGAFPVRLVGDRLRLSDALLDRGSLFVRESLGLLFSRGGALAGLLRVLHWRSPPLCVWMVPTPMAACLPTSRPLRGAVG